MRRGLNAIIDLLFGSRRRPQRTSGGRPARPPRPPRGSRPTPSPAGDVDAAEVIIEYSPSLDGDPDPGEVVWTWVPFEDDPSQGKDRPVVIIGRRGRQLVGVALTSKRHDREPQVEVGTGPWDREGRTSYAKTERLLSVDPHQVRREGAVLSKARFDAVIDGLEQLHGSLGPLRR